MGTIKTRDDLLKHLYLERALQVAGHDTQTQGPNIICPFHDDTRASFRIFGSSFGFCYGCNWSGNSLSALQQYLHLDTDMTLRWVEEHALQLFPSSLALDIRAIAHNQSTSEEKLLFWQKFYRLSQELLESGLGATAVDWLSDRGVHVQFTSDFPLPVGMFDKKAFNDVFGKAAIKKMAGTFQFYDQAVVFPYFIPPNRLTALKFRKIGGASSDCNIFTIHKDSLGFYGANYLPQPDNHNNNFIVVVEGEFDVLNVLTNCYRDSCPQIPIVCCSGAALARHLPALQKFGYDKPLLWLDNDKGARSILQGILKQSFSEGKDLMLLRPPNYLKGDDPAEYVRKALSDGGPFMPIVRTLLDSDNRTLSSKFIAQTVLEAFPNEPASDDRKWELVNSIANAMGEYRLTGLAAHEYLNEIFATLKRWPTFQSLSIDQLKHSICSKVTNGHEIHFIGGKMISKPDGYYLPTEEGEVRVTDFTLSPYRQRQGENGLQFVFKAFSIEDTEPRIITLTPSEISTENQFRPAMTEKLGGCQLTWIRGAMPNFLATLAKKCIPSNAVKVFGWQPGAPYNLEFCGQNWRIKDKKFELWDDMDLAESLKNIPGAGKILTYYTDDMAKIRRGLIEYIRYIYTCTSNLSVSSLMHGYVISGLLKPLLEFKRGVLIFEGAPGSGKTEGAASLNCLWAPYQFEHGVLLISATSTITSLEITCDSFSGITLILDDVKKGNLMRSHTGVSSYLSWLQNYYDGQTRRRATADCKLRETFEPGANVIITAEETPSGDKGAESRFFPISFGIKNNAIAMNPDAMHRLQEEGLEIPYILPAFIQFLCKFSWLEEKRKVIDTQHYSRQTVYTMSAELGLHYLKVFAEEVVQVPKETSQQLDECIRALHRYHQHVVLENEKHSLSLGAQFETKLKRATSLVTSVPEYKLDQEKVGDYNSTSKGYEFLRQVAAQVDTGQFVLSGVNQNAPGTLVGSLDLDNDVVWLEPQIVLRVLGKDANCPFNSSLEGSLKRQMIFDESAYAKKNTNAFRRRWPIPLEHMREFSEAVRKAADQLSAGDGVND